MKISLYSILIVLCLCASAISGVVRLDLKADIRSDTAISVFDGRVLIPDGEKRDVFAGPYTLTLSPKRISEGKYDLKVDLAGLGPDFKKFNYDFELAVGEKTLIPSLPVKNAASIFYSITILDDTSTVRGYIGKSSKPAEWRISTTVHYFTRTLMGSLADFTWNNKMGYLENIYNQYRYSYKLSMFEKIDITFYPEPTDTVYMDSERHYAILPNSDRIDLVYGHDVDAATPSPAAELLIYKQWGYGPRWMVAGMAHFYDGNDLILRKYARKLDRGKIRKDITFDEWVDSDSGAVFCGGFVNWLLNKYNLPEFIKLYKDSSPFDYEFNFNKIYGRTFESAIAEFIDYMVTFKPKTDELDYYAQLYLRHNQYGKAAGLYEEMSHSDGEKKEEYLVNLAACRYWGGEYESSSDTYDELLRLFGDNPRYKMLKADDLLALGDSDSAVALYEQTFTKNDYGNSGLRLVTILIDEGLIDSAQAIFNRLKGDVTERLDYSIEEARLKIIKGYSNANLLLDDVVKRALAGAESSPEDPRGYLAAGKAFALLGQYDKAADNLEIAFFLETRPYFLAQTLMEQGKTADLQGKREKAIGFYKKALRSGGGVYMDKLCENYIASPYRLQN